MLNRDIIEQMNRLRMDRDLLQKELEMIRSKSEFFVCQ